MKCRDVCSVLFDYRDGSLSANREKEIERHLISCSSCRELLAGEARLASKYSAFFAERRRTFPFQAEAMHASHDEHQFNHRLPSTKRKRFIKVTASISIGAAMVVMAVLLFRSTRLQIDFHAPRASSITGDLPDPFRDWIERRMIIIIEDKNSGTYERIEANRNGIIARSVEKRGNR